MKLSILIMTFNEEANIARCLESVNWADEIIVVDSLSTDQTVEIVKNYTDKVFLQPWLGFAEQRNIALSKAKGEWVFLLDADEEVTVELKNGILDIVQSMSSHTAYGVERKNHFMGRFLKGYVEDQVRLFKNGSVHYRGEVEVHESPVFEGSVGTLNGDLRHYVYKDLEHYVQKLNVYSTLGAKQRLKRGKKCRWTDLTLRPVIDFIKHYFIKGSFKDGVPGLVFSVSHAYYTFCKYAKLYEMRTL
jgi:glycosyltransferase involved in cell wall biosynthesis